MAKKPVTWIVIADGHRARVFLQEGPGMSLSPSAEPEMTHALPASRDIVSDRPGRSQESAGTVRHAIEPRVDWHRHEKQLFAQEIAKKIASGAARKAFERLVLVAPPQMLGDLRSALPQHVKAMVVAEVAKDLTQVPMQEIAGHLEELSAT
jgi:protein required for attachment to host cells